tara:strand:- start:1058 stop:1678 length:621 start_codon:yes stop_codon:yes gene_type:complete
MNKNYLIFKYIIDFIFASLVIILGFFIFIFLYLFLYFFHGLPIFFVQKRRGFGGRYFLFYKFRTMNQNSSTNVNPYFCGESDNRITSIGKFFRKYSLDELPQILNILKGDMTFVGPRPPVYDEYEYEDLTDKDYELIELREQVRPGLTGLAQINGRNANAWSDKLNYDKQYITMLKNSFWLCFLFDLQIIVKTIREVFYSSGEYDL